MPLHPQTCIAFSSLSGCPLSSASSQLQLETFSLPPLCLSDPPVLALTLVLCTGAEPGSGESHVVSQDWKGGHQGTSLGSL